MPELAEHKSWNYRENKGALNYCGLFRTSKQVMAQCIWVLFFFFSVTRIGCLRRRELPDLKLAIGNGSDLLFAESIAHQRRQKVQRRMGGYGKLITWLSHKS